MPRRSPKTKAVVNPAAGGGRAQAQWAALAETLENEAGDALPDSVVHTASPRGATRLTREALRQGYDRILAVGGDGTLGEVVNGFWGKDGRLINSDAVLVPIACGTAGDFARSTAVAEPAASPAARAEALVTGHARRIDAAKVTYTTPEGESQTRYFLNVASFGMGGAVVRRVHQSKLSTWMGGEIAFFCAIAQVMFRYQYRPVELRVDGETVGAWRVRSVAVANGRYFGGGLEVAPRARLDDGLLDVTVLGDFSWLRFGSYMRRLYAGTPLSLPKAHAFRGRRIRVVPLSSPNASSENGLLEADGEAIGRLPATFEVLPDVLRVQC